MSLTLIVSDCDDKCNLSFKTDLSRDSLNPFYVFPDLNIRGDFCLDLNGNPIIAGQTVSTDFPVSGNGFDNSHNGSWDGVIAQFNGRNGQLIYSSYFGGGNADGCNAVSIDAEGFLFVGGFTLSTSQDHGFPISTGTFDPPITEVEMDF